MKYSLEGNSSLKLLATSSEQIIKAKYCSTHIAVNIFKIMNVGGYEISVGLTTASVHSGNMNCKETSPVILEWELSRSLLTGQLRLCINISGIFVVLHSGSKFRDSNLGIHKSY